MNNSIRVLITVEGGVVTSVSGNRPMEVAVIDYDDLASNGNVKITELDNVQEDLHNLVEEEYSEVKEFLVENHF